MIEIHPANRLTGENSTIIKVGVPPDVLPRLYNYMDKLEETGVSTNQESVMRHALYAFLEARGY